MNELFVTPNDVMGDDDSASIQNAVCAAVKSGARKVVIPRRNQRTGEDKWIISRSVRLPSDFVMVLDNCFMQMADDVVAGFFVSDNLFTERARRLDMRMRNIHIIGIGAPVLDGGRPTELNEETQAAMGVPVRLNSPIFFINVENFTVENVHIHHQRYWGMRFEFCARGRISNIFFDICRDRRNQDGINLRNGCHDILIENVSGQTGDDMIALSAIDSDGVGGFYETHSVLVDGHDWDIHDVTIRNISGCAITHPLVALRPASGARIYNIQMENLKDRAPTRHAYKDDEPRYAVVHLGNRIYGKELPSHGDLSDITVRDVYTTYSTEAVLVHGGVKNLLVSGVHASGECRAILSVIGDNWGDDVYGVTLENVTVDSVIYECTKDDGVVFDFSYMADGDFVKGLTLDRANIKGTKSLAVVHEKCAEFDLKLGLVSLPEGADGIESTDQAIKIKRNERNLPPFKSPVQRDDI